LKWPFETPVVTDLRRHSGADRAEDNDWILSFEL
jgi:hypothetical protein